MKTLHGMKRRMVAFVALCVAAATIAFSGESGVTIDPDTGDATVAAGGTIYVGPTGTSTNNSQGAIVTFVNGGTLKAIKTSSDGNVQADYRVWRELFVNGTVLFDSSDLGEATTPEFRSSVVASNGTLSVSSDRSAISIGAGASLEKDFPLYDMPNIVFASGAGTVRLNTVATLRDVPGGSSANVAFNPSRSDLAIAGQGIVSNHTDFTTGRASFGAYGSKIVLLDESYIPDGVTPVVGEGKTFSIRPSDIVVKDSFVYVGSVKKRMVWQAKAGSGDVPFGIDLNGGTLELVAPSNSTYTFSGKVAGGGAVNFQGAYTRTFNEIEGTFAFTNTTSAAGTVRFNKVNPGSRLCDCGRVAFEFGEGALPATAFTVECGSFKYVFVPAADGTIDVSGMNGVAFRNTSASLPIGGDMEISAAALAGSPKLGVTDNANVTLNLDGSYVPSVVGGDGTFTVKSSAAASPMRVEGRSGAVVVEAGADVELRGTFAGSLTVDGAVTISEQLPWSAADVPSAGRVDWYDSDDAASLELRSITSGTLTFNNAVDRFYPRGETRTTLDSGCYLWAANGRQPFAVTGARGIGTDRTWIDDNHPDGYTAAAGDGNALRFVPYTSAGATGDATTQSFRTLLIAMDSSKGGGSVACTAYAGATGDFRKRETSSASDAIWPNDCSTNVKNGTTRLNGAAVDYTKGFTGAPEVLSLTANDKVSAICFDYYQNTQSSGAGGTVKSNGLIYGEVLMYDSVLDADVLANLEAYLMGKWTGVLPDGWSDLREATVTAGTGMVTAPAAKMPAFGDGFTGTVSMPDTSFTFTFDGSSGTVSDAFIAHGATLDLPSAVTVNVVCTNMSRVAATSVPLFDVAGFADNVEWTLVATGTNGRTVRLREADGKLLLVVSPTGFVISFR